MKIAVIAPTEIPARRANTVQIMKMAQALAVLGHEVRLAAPAERSAPAPTIEWEQLAHHYGLHTRFPVERLPASGLLRRYDYGLRALSWTRNWRADLLYTRLPQAAAFASLAGQRTILEAHDLPQGTAGPWFFRGFLSGRGACRLVVITRALAQDLASRYNFPAPGRIARAGQAHDRDLPPGPLPEGRGKVRGGQINGLPLRGDFTLVAPDGVDLERYQDILPPEAARWEILRRAPGLAGRLKPDRFTAGYTGHLYPGRGVELLLELAGHLPEVTVLISGGEPAHVARLQEQATARRLENVILTGFVANADLPLYQAACDVLLMPYQAHVEASSGGDIARYLSPMKLFEYLACGRPILSSDLPVLQEVLNETNALLLPAGNIPAWAEAVRILQADPSRRAALADQAHRDAQNYTWESRAARILDGLAVR